METPEYIEGIPTEKNATRKRREIIKDEYIHLIERLQKKRGKKAVFNEFLQTDIYIIMRESEKKPAIVQHSTGNPLSLCAIWKPLSKKRFLLKGNPYIPCQNFQVSKRNSGMSTWRHCTTISVLQITNT